MTAIAEKPQYTEQELEQMLAEKRKEKRKKEQAERKQYQDDKDLFLTNTINHFRMLNDELSKLKKHAISKANQLYNRMYEINGKEPKEVFTFTLKSEDDKLKIMVDRQKRLEFTPEADVHINSIKEFFKEKYASRNKGLYAYFDEFLAKNSKGDYDPKDLIKAKRKAKELGDDDLIGLVEKLLDCQRVVGTSMYCRAYAKDENGKWQDISLNFSSL